MAWTDEPSEAQLDTVFYWLSFRCPRKTAISAVDYLKQTATRKDVFEEVNRLKRLKDRNALTKESCFDSEIWEGFSHD